MRSRLRSLVILFGIGVYTLLLMVHSTKSMLLWLGDSSKNQNNSENSVVVFYDHLIAALESSLTSQAQRSLAALDDRLLAAHSKALDAYVNCVARDVKATAGSSERACRRDAMGIFDSVAVEGTVGMGKEAETLVKSARKLLKTGLDMLQGEVNQLRLAAQAASDEQRQALAWIGEMAQRSKDRENVPRSTGVRLRGDSFKKGGVKDAISSILGSIEVKSPGGGARFDSGGGENGKSILELIGESAQDAGPSLTFEW